MPSFLVSTIAQTAKIIWSGDEINLNLIPEATFNLRASPVNVWNKRVFFFFLALLSCVRHAYESFCRFLSFPHTETKVPVEVLLRLVFFTGSLKLKPSHWIAHNL